MTHTLVIPRTIVRINRTYAIHPSQEILDPASILLPLPPAGGRIDDLREERKDSRVRENKFRGWVVGWQAEHMQKMETENWCRNCKFSGDNSSTEGGIFLVHPPPSFLPLETSTPLPVPAWITTSAAPARLLSTPTEPEGGRGGWMYLKIFSPSSVRFRGVPRRAVKSYRFVCVSPFRQASPGLKIFGWNPRRINRRPAALFLNFE